jgi:citrate lyase subunit beta-like protein
MLDKSRSLKVDCVAYDLEDSVTSDRKAEARSNIRRCLEQTKAPHIREQAVRINAVGSGLALDDLTEVVRPIGPAYGIYPTNKLSTAESFGS